jgi:hypothetical protein
MKRVYLDTNAFRYFGTAFEKTRLDSHIADRMLISPLSAFEVLAQLAGADGDTVLRQIHAIHNWTNPQHSGLLPWPDDVLYWVWFGKMPVDDGFTKKMQHSFNLCLSIQSVATIKAEATQHKQVMDDFKLSTAQNFKDILIAAKNEKKKQFDISQPWFEGIAKRVKADPKSKAASEVLSSLSAYYEYDQSKLEVALKSPTYNPTKNRNDIIDAEQLVYLPDPDLVLLTCDKGFRKRVTQSQQAGRIITVPIEDLLDAQKAEALLHKIME